MTIRVASTWSTVPVRRRRSRHPSHAPHALHPVRTNGASARTSGTAWRCMLEPISARLASSFSRNGISARRPRRLLGEQVRLLVETPYRKSRRRVTPTVPISRHGVRRATPAQANAQIDARASSTEDLIVAATPRCLMCRRERSLHGRLAKQLVSSRRYSVPENDDANRADGLQHCSASRCAVAPTPFVAPHGGLSLDSVARSPRAATERRPG